MVAWAWVGAGLALIGVMLGGYNARRPAVSTVARDDYGMTPRSHARFAALSAVFVAAFVCAAFVARLPSVPLLALYTLALVLYGASFARGHADA